MWESLLGIADGLVESVGEGVTQVIDSRVGLQVQKLQEKRKDPEVLKAAEPKKAQRTDGATIVAAASANSAQATANTIMGIDKQTLMIGGGVLTALVISIVLLTRGRG